MSVLRFVSIAAMILLAAGPVWSEIGKGVPGMYQKIYSGSDVSTGDPEDGGVVIAAGAGLLAVAAGNPSISYTDPATSTKYTLAGSQTVAYKGVMKLAEGFFRDAANGDYRPRLGSVLRNRGMTLEGQMSETDLNGRPRVIGSSVDIGCYETVDPGVKMTIR